MAEPSTTQELKPQNARGKPLFPSAVILVACDQCDRAQTWPLTCGHNYARIYSQKYVAADPAPSDTEQRLREALAQAALPYEALLVDAASRKWIAPEIWSAIETAVTAARAALQPKAEQEQK